MSFDALYGAYAKDIFFSLVFFTDFLQILKTLATII